VLRLRVRIVRSPKAASPRAHPFAVLHRRGARVAALDCNDQLEIAMRAIAAEGRGLVIYEHQEGRGIGLMAKLRALRAAGRRPRHGRCQPRSWLPGRIAGTSACPPRSCKSLAFGEFAFSRTIRTSPARLSAAVSEVVALVPCEAAPTPYSLSYLRPKGEDGAPPEPGTARNTRAYSESLA